MANNRFNMQVTPKGYKAGGKVSPTKKAGPKAARSPSKQQRKMGAGARDKKKTAIDKINKTKAIYSSLKDRSSKNFKISIFFIFSLIIEFFEIS